MNEIINERISVITVYDREKQKVTPVKLKWQGRIYKIKQVGLHYPVRKGRKLVHYFSVISENNTAFKLKHDTENLHWILEEIIDEFAS